MLPWKFWFSSFPYTASLDVILGKSQGTCLCPQWGWSCPLHGSSACSQALLRVWFQKEPSLNPARLMSVSMNCHSYVLPQRMRFGQCHPGESALVLLQTIHSFLNVSLLWSSLFKIINLASSRRSSKDKCIDRYDTGSHCSTGELFIYLRVLNVGNCLLKLVLTEPGMLLGPS